MAGAPRADATRCAQNQAMPTPARIGLTFTSPRRRTTQGSSSARAAEIDSSPLPSRDDCHQNRRNLRMRARTVI
jgi:hypothetical protein